MSQNRLSALYICLAVLVSLWFASTTPQHIPDAALMYDASQNAKIAYYLVHNGAYTSSKKEPDSPSKAMKREPVPVLAISAFLLLHPSFDTRYKTVDLEQGRLTRTVKLRHLMGVSRGAVHFPAVLGAFFEPDRRRRGSATHARH